MISKPDFINTAYFFHVTDRKETYFPFLLF